MYAYVTPSNYPELALGPIWMSWLIQFWIQVPLLVVETDRSDKLLELDSVTKR
jgi:hypothetical protein